MKALFVDLIIFKTYSTRLIMT